MEEEEEEAVRNTVLWFCNKHQPAINTSSTFSHTLFLMLLNSQKEFYQHSCPQIWINEGKCNDVWQLTFCCAGLFFPTVRWVHGPSQ